jgi:hypothetical protein
MRDLCRSATTGVKANVRMKANARGIRITRAKYSAAIVPNSMTIAQLLELGRWGRDALMATGAEALRESAALVAGPLSGRPWKNGRFQKKAMLEAVGAFTPREGPELFGHWAARQCVEISDLGRHVAERAS